MRLKSILLIAIILTLNVTTVSAQSFKNKEVQSIIDSTLSVMKNNAVNRNKVDWNVLKQTAYKQAGDLNSPYELGDVIRDLFRSVDDSHGKFFYRDSIFQWNGNNNVLLISDSVKTEWNKRSGIKTAMLDKNIAYLRVPSIVGGSRADFDREAQKLNDSLCSVITRDTKGIVLDLRINGGGAMFPMILGLKQLLKEGKLGEFQTRSEKTDWVQRDNTFMLGEAVLAAITPKCIINAEAIPCVVLIGPGTGSSGEFLTMVFKARKNTALLGTSTVGAITSLTGFQVTDSAFLNLAIGYGRDKNGNKYTEAIAPDIVVDTIDRFNDLKKDEKVQAAIKWINSKQ